MTCMEGTKTPSNDKETPRRGTSTYEEIFHHSGCVHLKDYVYIPSSRVKESGRNPACSVYHFYNEETACEVECTGPSARLETFAHRMTYRENKDIH